METFQAIQLSLLSIFLLTVPAIIAQERNGTTIPCVDAHFYLNKLEQLVTGMCAPPPDDCPCPVDWESIEPRQIGIVNMASTTLNRLSYQATYQQLQGRYLYMYVYTQDIRVLRLHYLQ